MKNNLVIENQDVDLVFSEIKELINSSRNKVYSIVNTEMLIYTGVLVKL